MNYGRYRVIEPIGHGSMGIVYRAHDPVIGRAVAIKVWNLPWLTPEQKEAFGARFRSEAEAAGALHHPNIVTLYDVGDGYLVIELVEGQTLASQMRARQRVDVPQALEIARQVADALDYAHARGVVHRELKPANIMVLPDGAVKVLDFGVARPRTRDTQGGRAVLGSAAYMAPEQLLGQRAGPAADLFSLGVIVHELLAGERPFVGTSEAAIVEQIKGGSPASLLKANPSLPPQYEPILLKALDKDPANRFEKASLFVEALQQAKAGGTLLEDWATPPSVPKVATPPTSGPRYAPDFRRWRPFLAAAFGLAAVLAAWLAWDRAEPVATTAPPAPRHSAPAPATPPPGPSEAEPTHSPPSSTLLLISTDPPEARVFVGGEEKGRAPLTLKDPPPGTLIVRAEMEDYLPAARLAIVTRGQSHGVSLKLERPSLTPTAVDVLSMPDGGVLSIDGLVVGKTNAGLALNPGVHVVEVRKDGFDPWLQEVEVGTEPQRIIATLEKRTIPPPDQR